MLLNEIAKETGMTKRAVKYYEEKGLLSVHKDGNGYRNYSPQDVETLKKISVYRKLGISIKDIQSLLKSGDKGVESVYYPQQGLEKVYGAGKALRCIVLRTQGQKHQGSSGPQDGLSDHTGIVEKVENGIVYTVEGNSGDSCRINQYAVGHYEILGYGAPQY